MQPLGFHHYSPKSSDWRAIFGGCAHSSCLSLLFLRFIFFLCMRGYVLSTINICGTMCGPTAGGVQKRALDPLELELWLVVIHYGGSGN